ncbi:MAG: hypothetical protein H7070_10660 [Saprospiraceae bacterium]|nr:hypothetical protein [Pyrinomonadaceae bacterium]
MKRIFSFALIIFVLGALTSYAQAKLIEPAPTPAKVIMTNSMPPIKPPSTPFPAPSQTPIIVGGPNNSVRTTRVVETPDGTAASVDTIPVNRTMSFGQMKGRIAEAKRQMMGRPIAIVATEGVVKGESVRVAFFDWKMNQIDYAVMSKEDFLAKDGERRTFSQSGKPLTVRTIRANGVNTPISLIGDDGDVKLPLLVQYPVVREGKYIETAYYMSTHPGLVTPEVVNAGKYYVRNVIEIARGKLREKGIFIQPKVADIAERLAAVEHVDHQRFRTEYHPNIYNDVYTLFALNEGQTYRYSVSSAGAGGMVQMIPSTYRMVRSQYPNVPLMPDFVEGMRNHVNASQAMLLYMQSTWNDLISRPAVSNALLTNIATQEQLMAAGYNSNPARLSGYINRGGGNWTNLIPRETKIYLQIYDSIERFVPMTPRTK